MDWPSKGNSGSQQQPPPPQQEQQGGGGKKRNRGRGGRGAGQGSGSDQGPSQGRGPGGPSQSRGPGGPSQGSGPGGPPQRFGSGGPPQGPPGIQLRPSGTSPFTPRSAPPFSQQTQVVAPTDASKPAWVKPGQFAAPTPVQVETSSKDPSLPQQPKPGKGKGKKGGAKQAEETAQAPTSASAPQTAASAPVPQPAASAPPPTPSQETLPQQPKSAKGKKKKGGAKQTEESQAAAPAQDTPLPQPEPKPAGKGRGKRKVIEHKSSEPFEEASIPVDLRVETPVQALSSSQPELTAPMKSQDIKRVTDEKQSEPPLTAPSVVIPSVEEPPLPPEPKIPGKDRGKKSRMSEKSSEPLKKAPYPDPEPPIQGVPQKDAPLSQPAQKGKDGGKPKDRGDGASQAAASVEEVTKQMAQTSISWSGESYIIPRRPQGQMIPRKPGLFEKKFTIEVNYLPITFKDINLKIFHYDVEFTPDRPKSLYRPALRLLLDRYVPNRNPAFDGKKNIYAAGTKLQFPNAEMVRDSVTVHDPERNTDATFDITVKLVAQNLSLSKLAEYLKTGTSTNIPQDVIQGIDIALRNAPTMNSSFVPVGRSFFAIPRGEQPTDLGGGFELWHGHYQSAIMAWKPYLNVDVANKAFPIPQSLLNFIGRDLNADPGRQLETGIRYKLLRFVKGLKIDYKLQSNDPSGFTKRTYKVNDLGDPPNRHRFKPDKEGSKEITVEQYFRDVKRIPLRFPHLPCIVTTNKNYLPLEFCHVTPNQAVMRKLDERQTATMVRSAAKGTDIRKDRIMTTIRQSGFNDDPCAREFGMQLNTNFEKVEAQILRSPKIRYANDADVSVRNGVWQPRSEKFINSPGLDSWVILNTDRRTGGQQINNLVKNFMQTGNNIGIPVREPMQILDISGRVRSESDFENEFRPFKDKVQIVVVIMTPFGIDDIYSKIKRAAELKVGVLTQCIKSATCDFKKMNSMTAHNILLKINSKISGVNHGLSRQTTPNILREPVMIIGADVTHPAPGSEGLSIAAVAASHDSYAFKYNMLYRLQPGRQEMIERLEEMIEQQLRFFFQRCKCKPKRLLYYRDGVSEGQFLQVLNIELRAIRAACKKLEDGYEPAVTFLVVQKRHHTRFFPGPNDWDAPKNKNVCAGTLVDTTITHPTEVDFYLVSHQSIQGTARPTKYHLLWDDTKIPQDDLEQLTYYLCHMFARCNRSVSYPAPTYYAHLAAFRARAWWDGQRYDSTNLRGEQDTKGRIQDHIVNNAPMFFV